MSTENSTIPVVSSSPERHTFQKNGYIDRCKEEGKAPDPSIIQMYESWATEPKYENRPVNDLEYDLRTTEWVLEKARTNDSYAQNIYAAMCNMRFVRKELFPYLRQDPDKDLWSCSWRSAGGIVADMLGKGDYIDWYCSGMGGLNGSYDKDSETFEQWQTRTGYMPEGQVTAEIEADLLALGWVPVPWPDDDTV